jgi:proline iminopeptidase
MAANEGQGYTFAMAEARRRGDDKAVAELTRIGPPPYSMTAMLTQRKWVNAYGGSFVRPMPMSRSIWLSLSGPEGTWFDLIKFMPGEGFSLRTLWPEISQLNFFVDGICFKTPVAIFAGRYDSQVSAELAAQYADRLVAPKKTFVWFEQSAHSPNFEEPKVFNKNLVRALETLTDGHTRDPATGGSSCP